MIIFYRTKTCSGCDIIEDELKRMRLACEIMISQEGCSPPRPLDNTDKPPVLIDNGQVVRGTKAIIAHLGKLEEFKRLWEKFQSDACYCDDEGIQ